MLFSPRPDTGWSNTEADFSTSALYMHKPGQELRRPEEDRIAGDEGALLTEVGSGSVR